MSTVIRNGFRWDIANWSEALAAVLAFQTTASRLAQDLLDNYLSCHKSRRAGWQSWMERRDEVRRTNQRDPAVDTDFSLVVFPVNGLSVPGVLGIIYTEHNAWRRAWLGHPGVCEYGFWNNADEPEGVSATEWAERGRNWDIALPDACATPALCGFTIDLVPARGPFPSAYSAGQHAVPSIF